MKSAPASLGVKQAAGGRGRETRERYLFGGLFFLLLILAWEWYGRTYSGLLFTGFTNTAAEFARLLGTGELARAFWTSNQAMLLGFLAGGILGVLTGLITGRFRSVERLLDPYLSMMIVSPMAALIPLIIQSVGIGLAARVLVVFLFVFPIVAVNTRAGLKSIDPVWVEMARSFGASELALWRRVLLPGAARAILSGLRLGIGRALSGMVIVELLLVSVGLGRLILRGMAYFRPEISYAVILAVILETVLLIGFARRIETRLLDRMGYER